MNNFLLTLISPPLGLIKGFLRPQEVATEIKQDFNLNPTSGIFASNSLSDSLSPKPYVTGAVIGIVAVGLLIYFIKK